MNNLLGLLFALLALPLNSQSWEELPDIPVELTFPVVAVVDDVIHIMGGGGASGASSAHYAFFPRINKWLVKAPVPYLAQQPGGATVNGKIHYLGGGYPNTGTRLDDHYVYDPATDSWSQAPKMPQKTAIHEVVGIGDLLYVMSGQPDKQRFEVYNSVDSSWTLLNNLPDANFWYGAITVSDGNIFRFGGGGYINPTDKSHVYNPQFDIWNSLPSLPKPNHSPDAAAINGKIYLSGGYYSGLARDDFMMFDPSNQTYTALKPMPLPRDYHRMVAVGDCLYVLGGNNNGPKPVGMSLMRYCVNDTTVVGTSQESKSEEITIHLCGSSNLCIENLPLNKSYLQLSIFDLNGKVMLQQQMVVQSGQLNYNLGDLNLIRQLYLVKIQQGENQSTAILLLGN